MAVIVLLMVLVLRQLVDAVLVIVAVDRTCEDVLIQLTFDLSLTKDRSLATCIQALMLEFSLQLLCEDVRFGLGRPGCFPIEGGEINLVVLHDYFMLHLHQYHTTCAAVQLNGCAQDNSPWYLHMSPNRDESKMRWQSTGLPQLQPLLLCPAVPASRSCVDVTHHPSQYASLNRSPEDCQDPPATR
ncbi:hypothetical protein AC579_4483 [Pseudocercospora musae]|uniref:Secreted protein n=1 Tax=Pseudocercospora musae TaxID=113226 RepID=A0A139H9Q0_9PEZI|nr:hypothetical protein AC579_4483 [Pseudocercospora musae]